MVLSYSHKTSGNLRSRGCRIKASGTEFFAIDTDGGQHPFVADAVQGDTGRYGGLYTPFETALVVLA